MDGGETPSHGDLAATLVIGLIVKASWEGGVLECATLSVLKAQNSFISMRLMINTPAAMRCGDS
jgi:hypothetical protein